MYASEHDLTAKQISEIFDRGLGACARDGLYGLSISYVMTANELRVIENMPPESHGGLAESIG